MTNLPQNLRDDACYLRDTTDGSYSKVIEDLDSTADELARLREALREALAVVDECYEATGHIKVAKGSVQRNKILVALAKQEAQS
jgi:hypothetical protein